MTKRVLVVDDDKDVRELLAEFLDSEGISVVLAGDGEEALAMLASYGGISLALSDVNMPRMGGVEFLKACKKSHPHVRVVLMSGATDFLASRSADDTAFFVLSKPFDFDLILDLVKTGLKQ